MRIALAACLLLGCARNVKQDAATSPDGKLAGAKELELDNGQVRDTGIVTYPGGDRVDWKKVELPAKHRGALDITLSWTPPRPGGELAFDVFDSFNARIGGSKRKQARGYSRRISINDAHGTYFIRVYAVGRKDAGRYRLGIDFDGREPLVADPRNIQVSELPKLPDVPEIEVKQVCDLFNFDFKNKDCADKCPAVNPPANWKGCENICTANPPNADIPACARSMKCPPGGDIRVTSCTAADFPPCPDPKNPDPRNLNCVNFRYKPVATRIGKKTVVGNVTEVMIMAGSNANVDPTWSAIILEGDTNRPLAGGSIKIVKVDVNIVIGQVRLTPDQVQANPRVLLSPPSRR